MSVVGEKTDDPRYTPRSAFDPIGDLGFNACTISLQSTILSFLASAVPRASSCSASSKQSDTKDAQPDRDSRLYQIRSFWSVAPNEKNRAISPGHQLREEQHDRVGNQPPDEPAVLRQDRGGGHRGGVEPPPAGGRCREDHHHPARKLVHQAVRRICREHARPGLRERD